MRSAKLSAVLLVALVAGCTDEAPTAARATPAAAHLPVAANNQQRTQSIEGLVAAIEAAGAAGDAAAYASYFSDDVEVITATGAILSGRGAYQAYVESSISGPFGGSHQDLTIRRVRFLTGTIAVVDLDIVFTAVTALPPGLRPTELGVLRTSGRWVVVKRGGDWQVVAVQTTPIPPPNVGGECTPDVCTVP